MAIGNNINQMYEYTDANGKKYSVAPASSGGYMQAYEQYAQSAADARKKYEDNLANTLADNNATTNSNYDNNARQAYVDYMRKQKALPSVLQSLGVRGGATESGLLNLYNNYGTSHAANEQQRAADLTKNQQNYNDTLFNYIQNYDADLLEKEQTAINNQINEYNNEVTRFSSSVAQYPTTTAGYEAYEQWIKNLEASSDPLKDIKVALVRQQMASQFPDGKPSSGGGGSGSKRRSGGYGSRGISNDTSPTTEGILTQIARNALKSSGSSTSSKSSNSAIANAIKTGAKAASAKNNKRVGLGATLYEQRYKYK